mmetsp:Transcript_5396/g.7615  ORF Transcript_5396/g.7615 Transcript_5396/m.7615 type:complete len:103 (-) Transcript_5396:24-332(-)
METPLTPPKPLVDRQRRKHFIAILISTVTLLLITAAFFGSQTMITPEWLSDGHSSFGSMMRDEPDSRLYLRASKVSPSPRTADHVMKLPSWAVRNNERRRLT